MADDVRPPVLDDDADGVADAPTVEASGSQSRTKRFGRAVLDRLPQLSVAIVAGLALCLSFPPFGWWYLAFLAFALLAWVLTRETTTLAGGFGYGFLFGLAFYLPLLPWISGFVGPIPWIALCVLEALFPALFGALAVAVRRLPGWPLWFAGLWAAQEWLKSTVPFGGFPWGVVAFSQTDGPLLSIAQVGGAPLLSFAVVLVGFSLAAITLEIVQWWRRGTTRTARPAGGRAARRVHHRRPAARPRSRGHRSGTPAWAPTTNSRSRWPLSRATCRGSDWSSTRSAARCSTTTSARRSGSPRTCAPAGRRSRCSSSGRRTPPTSIRWPIRTPQAEISAAAAAIDAPILVGSVVAAPGYSPDNPVATNSVIVWNPETGPADRHDKQIVQPFGEYLPWRSFFRLLSPYADRAGYFVPGSGNGVVHAAGVPVGVTTCWEVIFDRAARESVRNGAQLLAVPTNNATFDEAMSEQQLAFARLRAVEHDRYVVVAGTTGISAVIAPDGRELARTEFFEPAYLDTQVRLKTQLTAATRWAPLVEGAAGRRRRWGSDRRDTAQWELRVVG